MIPTIFAAATPAGRSALCVLRIAGPQSHEILNLMAPNQRFANRQAKLTKLYAADRSLLDEALVLKFSRPHSYTGEDLVELYLHGSPAVARAVQRAIMSTQLARHAEPGEFTRRAFQNQRLDLTQVEGIRDLLAAETEMQRKSAINGAVGQFGWHFERWRGQLVHASAQLMAAIDFAEDNGLDTSMVDNVRFSVGEVRREVAAVLNTTSACSELIRNGLRIALLGEPNAGKSSLTNRLVHRAAAIVSDIPGTTRDVLEIALEVAGHKVVLLDTAGIRSSSDPVETLGIARAREVVDQAHLVIALTPAPSPVSDEIKEEIERLELAGKPVVRVQSKSDLVSFDKLGDDKIGDDKIGDDKTGDDKTGDDKTGGTALRVSAVTGAGIDDLLQVIKKHAQNRLNQGQTTDDESFELGLGLSLRAQALLSNEVVPGLDSCQKFLSTDIVLANAEIQRASTGIGMITGKTISVHEVLDVVFGEFCIGK